jgi:hypothetical protein
LSTHANFHPVPEKRERRREAVFKGMKRPGKRGAILEHDV